MAGAQVGGPHSESIRAPREQTGKGGQHAGELGSEIKIAAV